MSFAVFVEDMGRRPAGYTLERPNNDGNYGPGNCVWASRKVQSNNRRTNRLIEHDGRAQTAAAWAEELGMSEGTIRSRIDRLGWPVGRALNEPTQGRGGNLRADAPTHADGPSHPVPGRGAARA